MSSNTMEGVHQLIWLWLMQLLYRHSNPMLYFYVNHIWRFCGALEYGRTHPSDHYFCTQKEFWVVCNTFASSKFATTLYSYGSLIAAHVCHSNEQRTFVYCLQSLPSSVSWTYPQISIQTDCILHILLHMMKNIRKLLLLHILMENLIQNTI